MGWIWSAEPVSVKSFEWQHDYSSGWCCKSGGLAQSKSDGRFDFGDFDGRWFPDHATGPV
jgi:hypothetical protein